MATNRHLLNAVDDDLDEESQTSVFYCDPDDVVFAVEPIFAAPSSSVDDALQLAEIAKQVHRDNSEHRSQLKESRRARRENSKSNNNNNNNSTNGADDKASDEKDDAEQHDRLRRSVTLLQGGAEVLQQLEDERRSNRSAFNSLRSSRFSKAEHSKKSSPGAANSNTWCAKVDIEALATAVEHGAQVSGFLLASLSKADREQLEHMLIAKQQERLRARRVLEEQLALVAAADERTLQYMTLIRNSGDGDGDDDAAADAAADADAPAPFTTQHEAAELHVLSDDDDDNSDDEVEAVAAAAPKEALASSGKGSRRSPRPTVAKKSAAVGAKDLTSPRPLTSSKSAGSGIGERTSPRTLTSSTSATLPPTSATLSPRSDSSESETTSKTSENGAKLTDSLSSKHRRRVHRDKGGGESKGGESKGEPEEVITSPRHRSHGSRTGSSAAASAAAAAAAAAASAAATTAAAAAAATVTPAASEPILSPRRHTSGDLVLPAAASPTDTALDAVVAGLPAPPLPPDSELPQAQTKAAQTQASLAAWRANARKDSFVSSTEILSESNLQKRAALKAEAPPVCTECMERKPRAKLTRNESVLWLCASCLAEKQTLYLKHGTLRRQEALAALQGRFVADTALAVARSAGKATLRRVNKVCGSCGKRKAKHKCTMTTGRQVVLCDKCLLTAKQRRAQLDASFGTAATANMAAAAVAGADSDRL